MGVSKGLDREAGHHHGLLGLGQVAGGLLAGDGAGKQGLVLELETKAIRRFVKIIQSRRISWLKAPTSAFTLNMKNY